MRRLFVLFCVFGISCASSAKTDSSSWSNLDMLQSGQNIQVVDIHSKKHFGTFLHVSDAGISYQESAGERTIPKQDVRRVKLMANNHRLRNTLIGGAVGAGAGAGIGAAAFHSCAGESTCIQPVGRGATSGIGAVAGLAAGAVVGALLPSHSTVYRANSR